MKLKRHFRYMILAAAAVLGVIGVLGATYVFLPVISTETEIYIKDDCETNLKTLITNAKSEEQLKPGFFLRLFDHEIYVRKGRYVLSNGISMFRARRILAHGMQTPVKVVLNPVRTPEQLSRVVAKYLNIDSSEMVVALYHKPTAENYGFTPENFFCMFVPNTYEFYWTISLDDLLDKMKKEYDKFWTAEREQRLKDRKLTKDQVLTIASIIDEETNQTAEMPRIAGVYINRLRINMPLQADPTVKFAIGDFTIKRIMKKHTDIDSPYNTYKYAGLPPGPIAIPSAKAIDAVLNYETHKYLYFCAKADLSGSHTFAENYDQHMKNARAYARKLNKIGVK